MVSDLGDRQVVVESRIKAHGFTIEMSRNNKEMWSKLKITNLD